MSEIISNELKTPDYTIKLNRKSINLIHVCYWLFLYVVIKQLAVILWDIYETAPYIFGDFFKIIIATLKVQGKVSEMLVTVASAIMAVFFYPIIIKGKNSQRILAGFVKAYLIVVAILLAYDALIDLSSILDPNIYYRQNYFIDYYVLMIVLVICLMRYSGTKFEIVDFLGSWYVSYAVLVLYAIAYSVILSVLFQQNNNLHPVTFIIYICYAVIILIYLINISGFKNRSFKIKSSVIAKILMISMIVLNFSYKLVFIYLNLKYHAFEGTAEKIKYIIYTILEYRPRYFIAIILFAILYVHAASNKEKINTN